MKKSEQVKKEQEKNRARIAELEKELDAVTYGTESTDAIQSGNMARYKELHAMREQNKDRITAICNEIYLLKVVALVLADNYRAAVVNEALPIIRESCAPYEGKAYGEKTKQKIYDSVRAYGYTFHFAGFTTRDRIEISKLDANGCCYSNDYINIYTKYDAPFVDSDNKLHFPAELKNPVVYSENPRKRAKEILKAFENYKKEAEKAERAQCALNAILPGRIDHFHGVTQPHPSLVY